MLYISTSIAEVMGWNPVEASGFLWASFDGRITTYDHIPTFHFRALSPPPHSPIRFILFFHLRIYRL